MKKITKKHCEDFLARIADIKPWDSGNNEIIDTWYSKIDGSFICFVSHPESIKWMLKSGITEQIQSNDPNDPRVSCIGFNPEENKWYGWSHRAVYGFGIGSEVKKGHAGYVAKNIDDFIEEAVRFWSDDSVKNVAGIKSTNDEGVEGVQVTWEYVSENVPNKRLHETIGGHFMYPPKVYGKGEWKAETIDDAKQMAIDFAEGVS